MEGKKEVLAFGIAVSDLQIKPIPTNVMEYQNYDADVMELTIGGDAINEAFILHRLGHQVTLMSMVGDDCIGSFLLDCCRKEGIDYSGVTVRKDAVTSINVGLLQENGVRSCVSNAKGSMYTVAPEDMDYSFFEKGYKILSFASIYSHPLFNGKVTRDILARAKKAGLITCVDTNSVGEGGRADFVNMKEAFQYMDYFFPNIHEAQWMTGKEKVEEIAEMFLSFGVKNIIIKAGSKGAYLKSATEAMWIPAYGKAVCIDETGAGDNFASGFISGLLEGKSFRDCGEYATACASLCIESIGTTTGVTGREAVAERLRELQAENNN